MFVESNICLILHSMSICLPPLKTKPLPTCFTNLILGKVSYGNTNVSIFIEDITTGATNHFDATTAGDGTITLSTAASQFDGIEFSDTHSYKAWVTKESAGIKDQETIYVGAANGKEVELNFEKIGSDQDSYALVNVTIEVEA